MTESGPDDHRQHHAERRHPGVTNWEWPIRLDRRRLLTTIPVGLGSNLTGCLSGPSFPDADVVAGADGKNVFEPAELTVQVGDTVIWGFASAGHNVCCRPSDSDEASLPTDAEAFASYGPDEPPEESFLPRGETYEHAFDVPGQYDYVCIPHESLGMTGTIHVE